MAHENEHTDVAPLEAEGWDSPAEHFRPKHKFGSLYADRSAIIARGMNFKAWLLDRWFVPTWSPLYFVLTHFSQRNRNLFLIENHLNYRPYKFRRNDEITY